MTNPKPWDFAAGQTHVQIETVTYGGDVVGIIAAIPLTCPDAEQIAEAICHAHNHEIDQESEERS